MMPFGASSRTRAARDVVPDDLAVDVLLAHAAGDQLGVLRAEIQDQHLFVRGACPRAVRNGGVQGHDRLQTFAGPLP